MCSWIKFGMSLMNKIYKELYSEPNYKHDLPETNYLLQNVPKIAIPVFLDLISTAHNLNF
jgi:hypothetical protein